MLANHFPADISLVVATQAMQSQRLSETEEAHINGSIEKRMREFRGGRNAAKAGLLELGFEGDCVLLPVEGGKRPDWPEGYIGSITHTVGFIAAVVARQADYRGIGIDVERRTPMRVNIVPKICTEREQGWIEQQPDDARKGAWGKTFFCIKESVYKAFNPIHHVYLGFQEVEVELNTDEESFTAAVYQQEHGIECQYSGRFSMDEQFIYASTLLK